VKLPVTNLIAVFIATITTADAWAAEKLYIPLGAANLVQIVDVATNRVSGGIADVPYVHGLAITPDQTYLIAGAYAESDSSTAPSRPVGVSEAEHERHHSISRDEANSGIGTSHVSIIDIANARVLRRLSVKGAVHHAAVSPDGRYAVTTQPTAGGISIIDLNSYIVIGFIATGNLTNSVTFTKNGERVYVSNAGDNTITEIDTDGWTVNRTILANSGPEHLVLSADDKYLYVNNVGDGTVAFISIAKGRIIESYDIGSMPHGIGISDDGTTLYVTDMGEHKLVAINPVRGRLRRMTLKPSPYHVTVVPGSGKLYVSSRAKNRVWVVDQKTLAVVGEISIGGIGHQMVASVQ
jgi:YVTN family beta-propeller protein